MFPKEGDPIGGMWPLTCSRSFLKDPLPDPEKWTREELRRWLAAVRHFRDSSPFLTFISTWFFETAVCTQGSLGWWWSRPASNVWTPILPRCSLCFCILRGYWRFPEKPSSQFEGYWRTITWTSEGQHANPASLACLDDRLDLKGMVLGAEAVAGKGLI